MTTAIPTQIFLNQINFINSTNYFTCQFCYGRKNGETNYCQYLTGEYHEDEDDDTADVCDKIICEDCVAKQKRDKYIKEIYHEKAYLMLYNFGFLCLEHHHKITTTAINLVDD